MAKKAKTPTPPRRVQAPKQRVDMADIGGRQRLILYGSAALGLVGIVVVVLLFVLAGGGGGVASAMKSAGCTYRSVTAFVPKGQGVHVPSLTKKFPWNTDPPSNGQHYPLWAVWGFYTEPVNPRRVVHNEEHGGVIYWWGTQVPQSTVEGLRSLYQEQPIGTFGTPYPKLGTRVAITAWTGNVQTYGPGHWGTGHIAICSTWNGETLKAFRAFRDAFRGKGPEGVPLTADEPGMGPPQ